jgi:phytoene synthase
MEESFRHCEELVRAADKDRFLATLFAPADKRGPLFALYAFNCEIVTVRNRAREPMPGEIRLQWWRDVLNGERSGEAAANPVAAALLDTVSRFTLPVEPLLDLIEGHAFDLYDDPMPTLAALEGYSRKTESSVVMLAARILEGKDSAGIDIVSEHSGMAIALMAVLRSFARHASRRQIYVPLEFLDRHGARVEGIYAGQASPALHAALADLRSEIRRHFTAFEAALPKLPPAATPAFLPAALVPGYLAITDRRDYDPFRSDLSVPQWRRQWVLWRAAHRWSRAMRR